MADLAPGFTDPARDGALAFRAALQAMSRPGRIETMPALTAPAPLSPAAAALILTLGDRTTPLHLAPSHDTNDVRDWVAFHTGAPLADAAAAAFALGTWDALQPIDRFPVGDPAYPDRSATLVVEMDRIANEGPLLTGPGIADSAHLTLPDVDTLRPATARFPLGVDLFLTAGTDLAALPRTTKLEAA